MNKINKEEIKNISAGALERLCKMKNVNKIEEVVLHPCGHFNSERTLPISAYNNEKYLRIEYVIDEENNSMLVIVITQLLPCETCLQKAIEESRMYCDKFKPVGFDNLLLYHGTQAYYKCTDEEAIQRIRNIKENKNWQICSSTKHIGLIGIALKSEVLCASNADLCSTIEEKSGRRYIPDFIEERAKYIINNINELDETKWSHTEMITTNNVIEHVWISSKASKELQLQAKNLAYELNIELVVVEDALLTK